MRSLKGKLAQRNLANSSSRDHKFNSQTTHNDLTTALRKQLEWCTTGLNIDPLEYINIFRPVVHMYNTRRMDRYLTRESRELDHRYNAIQEVADNRNKSVIDLALKTYLEENPSAIGINADFKDFAIAQIKLFIFAGHDTTSAGAIFTYHLLTQHPKILAKVRAEHDSVFGFNIAAAASLLSAKPTLLNQLPYTLAVIKESLRIYPTVAALRDGQADFYISSESGKSLPTNHCLVWGDHYGTHHNPRYWARPEEFLPERFLVSEGDELYPPKNAWRPFERGPRNCIGQELALTEIKVMLALTIRAFDFEDAYEEYDTLKEKSEGLECEWSESLYDAKGWRSSGGSLPMQGDICEGDECWVRW